MKRILLVLIFPLVFFGANSTAQAQNSENIVNQIIQHYNKQNYKQALELLETIKVSRDNYPNWYYYFALILTRQGNYSEALVNFQTFVKNSDAANVATARAYYYIGLIQFELAEYEKSLNSLEISLDVSGDVQLDSMTEALIDKTIRYQNYFDNSKKTNVTLLLGYNFDANTINLSPESFDDSLNGNVLGYGISFSHKAIDRFNFVFEPTLAVLDNYTMDSKFRPNSTLQSTDALQALVSLPIRFFFDEEKISNRYEASLNAYSVYLPITTTTRELLLNSVFLKTQVSIPHSVNFAIRYSLTVAADTAYGFTSEDDDTSGSRVEFLTTFTHFLSQQTINNIFYDLGADSNSAKGVNSRFRKFSGAVGYMYPSFWETITTLRLAISSLSYPDKSEPRTDTQAGFSYNVVKAFASGSTLGFSVSAVNNSSNITLNKYNDFVAGFQYTRSFGF